VYCLLTVYFPVYCTSHVISICIHLLFRFVVDNDDTAAFDRLYLLECSRATRSIAYV